MKSNIKPKRFGRRYPWETWFAKGTFTLRLGKDFTGRIDTMSQYVRNMASQHGYAASVSIAPNGLSLTARLTRKK